MAGRQFNMGPSFLKPDDIDRAPCRLRLKRGFILFPETKAQEEHNRRICRDCPPDVSEKCLKQMLSSPKDKSFGAGTTYDERLVMLGIKAPGSRTRRTKTVKESSAPKQNKEPEVLVSLESRRARLEAKLGEVASPEALNKQPEVQSDLEAPVVSIATLDLDDMPPVS